VVIETINSFLLLLQRALAARSLYPSSHPAVRASEEEAYEQMVPVLEQTGKITVAVVNDRVVWNEELLPAGRSLCQELFSALRRSGADRIGFRKGLRRDEIEALLDALADSRPLRALGRCHHLEFGPLAGGAATDDPESTLQPCAEGLEQIFERVHRAHALERETLERVVNAVADVVSSHAGLLLPLLETKQHDEYTFVHTTNVAVLSTAMAEALGFEANVAADITAAALLHDVGKRAVPTEILNKTERLTDEDVARLRRHPVDGARMLFNTPGVPDLAVIVAYEHHVRADGGGYPATPRGWRLNLASRIVQIADVFDALRTNRPYRAALPVSRIREIMRNDVGTVFDATLLTVFFQQVLNRRVPGVEAAPFAGTL